jgi:hypothetical protein
MMRQGTFPRLPIIPFFGESDRFFFLHDNHGANATGAHVKSSDCTHYSYAPSKFEKLWEQIALLLALPVLKVPGH